MQKYLFSVFLVVMFLGVARTDEDDNELDEEHKAKIRGALVNICVLTTNPLQLDIIVSCAHVADNHPVMKALMECKPAEITLKELIVGSCADANNFFPIASCMDKKDYLNEGTIMRDPEIERNFNECGRKTIIEMFKDFSNN